MAYYIQNEETGEFLGFGGKPVDEYPDAEKFETQKAAFKALDKLDPEWNLQEV